MGEEIQWEVDEETEREQKEDIARWVITIHSPSLALKINNERVVQQEPGQLCKSVT